MITYEKFKEIITKYIQFSKVEEQLRKMNIDLVESPLFSTTGYYLDWLWEAYFTEDARDTINWWIFEYHNIEEDFDEQGNYIGDADKEPGMWDKDDNVIPMITIEDLWDNVKDLRLKIEGSPEHLIDLQEVSKPIDIDILKAAVGDEYKNIIKFFGKPENLVCVSSADENISEAIASCIKSRAPYKNIKCDRCDATIYLDSEVGVLLTLSADNFTLYIWQQ